MGALVGSGLSGGETYRFWPVCICVAVREAVLQHASRRIAGGGWALGVMGANGDGRGCYTLGCCKSRCDLPEPVETAWRRRKLVMPLHCERNPQRP